jgi:hypothetical protein
LEPCRYRKVLFPLDPARRLQGMLREASAWWNPCPERMSGVVDDMIAKRVVYRK